MSVTAYSNFPKIDSGTVISSNQSSNRPITAREDTENNGTIKTTSGRGKFLSTKSKNEINDKEVVSILEDFRIAYPIKEQFKTVVGNIEEGEKESSKNAQKYNKTFSGSFGMMLPGNKLGKMMKNTVYGGIHTLKQMKLKEKQEMFKKSIFTKLIPPHSKLRTSHSSSAALKRKVEDNNKYGPFLNFDYEAFNKKVEITNPLVKKYLESINFFGPYFSYCPPCRNRNFEFYQNLEPNQCIDIIKWIKKAKGKSLVFNKEIKKTKKEVIQ